MIRTRYLLLALFAGALAAAAPIACESPAGTPAAGDPAVTASGDPAATATGDPTAAGTAPVDPSAAAPTGTSPRRSIGGLIDSARSILPPHFLTYDLLVEPDKDVALEASLRSGVRVIGIGGKRVQFVLDGAALGEATTDKHGNAALAWKVPAKAGDYLITVQVHPEDQPKKPIAPAELLVCARAADAPMIAVDLDKTVVQSGFGHVLLGTAVAMPDAAAALTATATAHAIIYLTQRPDFMGPESKRWLTDHGFPRGPMLTTTLGNLLVASGKYKSGRLEDIRRTFPNVVAGVGDKFSDAKAYADNGLRPILILAVAWSEDKPEYFERLARQLADLPDTTQIVTNWQEAASVLSGKLEYTKKAMETRLRDAAQALRSKASKKD
jgi:hypothetical protein